MKTHLLVTNDFPPKVGGIQSYLWELWRRLPPDSFAVLTTPYEGTDVWDARQRFRIERTPEKVLLPTRSLARRIDSLAAEIDAGLVYLDPALPLGALGRRLERPYGVIVHGAEVTVPGRIWGTRSLLGRVLRGANHVVAAGHYPLLEAERAARRPLAADVIPPGVDVDRFRHHTLSERAEARAEFGIEPDAVVLGSVSRLVPRKGMDVLIRASALLGPEFPQLRVVIAGAGRDLRRLERLVKLQRAPVRFMGRVPDRSLPRFVGCLDLFAMVCRNRWAGLEQEGFGIVFLEASASGVAAVAGNSGGAAEAVLDGVTGRVVMDPTDPEELADALAPLLRSPEMRATFGVAGRRRARDEFSYDVLAHRLYEAIERAMP